MLETRALFVAACFATLLSCGCNGPRSKPDLDLQNPPQNTAAEVSPATVAEALAQSKDVAASSLNTLKAMAATEGRFKMLGFASAEEVGGAVFDDPVPVRIVRLDNLREYNEQADPQRLARFTSPNVIYPVHSGGKMRSAITIGRAGGEWQVITYGLDPVARLLATGSAEGEFIVSVSALNVFFMGSGGGREMKVTPLQDYPKHGFKKGVTLLATKAFSKLAKAARKHSGLPS